MTVRRTTNALVICTDLLLAHHAALVQKLFFINFLTSYIPLFITAFIYMPFGNLLVPYLDIFKMTAEKLSSDDAIVTQS